MLSADYTTVNTWNNGFQGAFSLVNDDSAPTLGWTVSFTASFDITQIWGARIVSREGDRYTVEALSWNGILAPGQTANFGFIGDHGGDDIAVSDIAIDGEPVVSDPDPVASILDTVVDEGDGEATVTVSLDGPAVEPIEISYRTEVGTAGDEDFSATVGTLTIPAGESEGSITVPIANDTEDEPNERFEVVLTGADGATIGDDRATVTIVDDDEAPPPVAPDISAIDTQVLEGNPTSGAGWLSTSGSKIVDEAGNEVIVSGVSWFGAETTRMAPDGLFTRNYKDMMDQMAGLGFNAIRLPFSNDALRAGASPNSIDYSINPELQGLSPLQIIDAIVDYAGEIGLRIILDNHRNAAGDGASANGLWYGEGTTEDEWIADWEMLAARYADNPTVVGFDLSNEPHSASWGSGDAATDWRLGAEKAIAAVHAVNPNLLVLVEGIGEGFWWGGNLKGVADDPIRLQQSDKLVYSPHNYANSIYNQPWFNDPNFPDNLTDIWSEYWGYIAEQELAPIMVGEFGSRFTDPKDIAWFDEFVPYLDSIGASWLYWSWNPNSGDTGGILADDWQTVNTQKIDVLEPILGGDLGTGTGDADPERLITVEVALSQATTQAVTVAYETEDGTAVAGTDYEATSGTITIEPGEVQASIPVTILANTQDDGDRSFTVRLTTADGGSIVNADATVTIIDDDDESLVPPSISIADATVTEGDGMVELAVTLDAPAATTVTADVIATAQSADGSDFALATQSIVIAPDDDRAVIGFEIVDDSDFEDTEEFIVSLSGLDGAVAGDTTATVTILDNDTAPPDPGGTDTNNDGIYATAGVDDDWGSGFVARGQVINDSGAAISGWSMDVSVDASITNIWNAEILSRSGDVYTIGNASYNANLGDGQVISWGFQGSGASGPIGVSDVDYGAIV